MHLPFLWPRESCLFSQNPNLTLSFRFPTYEKHWVTPPRKPLVLMKRQWSPVAGVPAFSLPSMHSFAQNVRAEWGSAGRICILKGEPRKQRSKMQMEGLGQTPAGVFQGSATGPPDLQGASCWPCRVSGPPREQAGGSSVTRLAKCQRPGANVQIPV